MKRQKLWIAGLLLPQGRAIARKFGPFSKELATLHQNFRAVKIKRRTFKPDNGVD